MRAPAFWDRATPSVAARLLQPAGLAYGAVAAARMRRDGERAAVPVVCVGNFTLGGAGKTPTALRIAALLQDAGETPAFLTRGYGGRSRGPVRVDTARHSAAEVGDEPLLLARTAPTVVARERPAGARLAVADGATVIVMDDGLQNPSLVKDFAIAVVDGETGAGNGLAFPAGPLRAPLSAQWPHVHAVVVLGSGNAGAAVADEGARRGLPIFEARLEPDAAVAARLKGASVLAFCGIGRPEKFFRTLEACGAAVTVRRSFPDHHGFSGPEIEALVREAEAACLVLATTEKDAARVQNDPALRAYSPRLLPVPVTLRLDDEAGFGKLLRDALSRARSSLPRLRTNS
jgi:tetraacyldisaccharide 4'-kinase